MTESVDEPELPPFSFSKKAVTLHNNIIHSAISDIIPSRNSEDRSLTPSTTNEQLNVAYNNIDYDEQIRAPRMNNVNYYTYTSKQKSEQRDSISLYRKDSADSKENSSTPATTANTSPTNETKQGKDTGEDEYSPAIFDLNQPTRRFSAPSNSGECESPKTTILNYTTNNYIYERTAGGAVRTGGAGGTGGAGVAVVAPETGNTSTETMEGTVSRSTDEKLLKALDNLKNNTTTRERQQSTSSTGSIGSNGSSGSRIKNRISSNNHPHPLNRTGSDLQQVYELKKPLCMPAVLRPGLGSNPPNLTPTTSRPETPNDISTTVDITSPTFTRSNGSMDSTGTSPTTPYVDIKAYPFPVGDNTNITITAGSSPEDSLSSMRIDRNQAAEPSHEHWRPNNYTTNCMKCFDTFGNFFTPQRKRRHHCRFCGSIFCFDCLWQIESDNFSTGGNVGHGIANRRLSRSTLNGSIQPTNGIVPSATATGGPGIGSVGGILLDSQAKFVVPIFSEIQKNGLSTQFDEYFKFCKVCKDCGNQYQSLVTELNSNEAAKTSPFLFIENPYLQQRKYGLVSSENNFENRQRLIERGRQMSGIKESDLPNAKEFKSSNDPKLQLNNVPSDWSWSSF